MSTNADGRKYVIAGGSGFLGISLANYLSNLGAEVVILSRRHPKVNGPWQHELWDARSVGKWQEHLQGADGLVNYTGRSVNCVKTPDHVDEILRSRIESTTVLGVAMRNIDQPPPVWVQMSTAHIYGDPPELVCDEDSAFGYGLAPEIGRAWEAAFRHSLLDSQKGVILRTSFVLGRDRGAGGGALTMLAALARYGLGGRVGRGKQGISWIHESDLNRLVQRSLFDSVMEGAYIASAPHPVSQSEFMRTLRRAVGMPIGLPAFAWMVRIAAPLILKTDPELALYGRYVVSKRLEQQSFQFRFPGLSNALSDLFGRGQSEA